MKIYDWDLIRLYMENGVVSVTFNKADGSERQMECTLASYLMPETLQKSNHKGDETMVVFDLEAEGWRAFRYDRVMHVQIHTGFGG